VREDSLKLPADYRLAFRELGLSIGLQAIKKIGGLIEQESWPQPEKNLLYSLLKILSRYEGLRETIETFWLERTNRESESWVAHRDINRVMLATSLVPDGFLRI